MASKTKLTIEIGNEFIKICDSEIIRKNTVCVHHAISIQTPEGAVEDGMVRDINAVADTIRTALSDEMITADSVTFVLSSSRVAAKEVIIPSVKKDKIQNLVNANASSYFPVNINDYLLSYTVLEEKNTKEEKKLRLLVYAAPEMIIESYYNLAKVLGKKVVSVDYSGNSTLQLIKLQTDSKPNLVVQIGMDTTILSVMNNNVLQLQRTIPYGESALLNEVMSSKNVKMKVALELLSSAKLIKDNLDADEITGSLKQLINNVNRVIEYYSGRNKETPLQKIVIIGEGADILGIDTLFSNETNLPSERLTLLKNVESYNRIKVPDTLLRQYMTNIGATLAPINFSPKALSVSTKEKKENSGVYLLACAGMVAVAVILTAIPFVQNRLLDSKKSKLNDDIKKYAEIEDIKADRDIAEEKFGAMNSYYRLTENNSEWINELLNIIEKEVPSTMTFSAMNIADGEVILRGNCTTKAEVAQFEVALKEKDNIISNLVTSINEETGVGVSFTMTCNMLKDSNLTKSEEESTTAEEAE